MDEAVSIEQALEVAQDELREELERLDAIRRQRLAELADTLEVQVQDAISKRTTVESRWITDLKQFHGGRGYRASKAEPLNDLTESDRPRVNITRDKCLKAQSQMGDLQFPGYDKNFAITATPDPELVRKTSSQKAVFGEGETVTEGQQALEAIKEAAIRAAKMEKTIWDQLEASKWGPESREAIRDLVILGTAVMRGVTVEGKVRKTWKKDVDSEGVVVHYFEYDTVKSPVLKRVDPWYFFPDMQAKHPEECEFAFELHPLNKKELAKLTKHPYFDREAISALLEQEPEDVMTANLDARSSITGADIYLKNKYQVFAYHGPISDRVIEAMGMADEDRRNPLRGYVGEVWFCQGQVLKVQLSNLEGDEGIPYVFTQWEPDETNPFGFGIPFLVRDAQRVVNSTWRMILDNAGLSAGPQVVVNRDMIQPANGKWDIEPMKVWYVTEYGNNPAESMFFFDVPSKAADLASVLDMALKFAEAESSMPMVAQNERESYGSTTATGLAMMVTESNVVQKRANKNWDDYITTILIDRFYTWNMLYHPDEDIKGDYDVVARGSTDLMSRQMATQDAATLLQATEQSEAFKAVVDQTALAKIVVSSMHVPADQVIKTDEQIAAEQERAQQNQQPDTEMLKLQLAQERLAFDRERETFDQQAKMAELDLKQAKMEHDFATFTFMSQAQIIKEQNEREQQIMKLASDRDMSAKQLMAEIGMNEKHQQTQQMIAGMNAAIDWETLKAKRENMAAKPTGYDSF